MLQGILIGLQNVFTPINLLFIIVGVAWGTIGGMIPGINSTIAMALLLPFTYPMDHTSAVLLLAGVYCGGEYGGSIPAILIGTPGTNAAACTVIDGYPLMKKGRPGMALYTSLMASCFGGLFGAAVLLFTAVPLATVALAFGPAEYFALAFLGLSMVCSLGEKNVFKGIIAGFLGILMATIGFDTFTGAKRYTFGVRDLSGGISQVALMMGLYAITEMFDQARLYRESRDLVIEEQEVDMKFPKLSEITPLLPTMLGCSALGTVIGVMPGAGATAASFLAYTEVKQLSKETDFGEGNPKGVAAPESANNAVTGGAMVPLLALGIPGSNSTAIMLAALSIHNVHCGPMLFQSNPEIPYGIFISLFVANLVMFFVGFFCIKCAMQISKIPKPVLIAVVITLVFTGAFAYSGEIFSMYVALAVGLAGVVLRKFEIPSAAIVLGFVLGEIMEANLRRALIISLGSYWGAFTNSTLSSVLLAFALVSIVVSLFNNIKRKKALI